ncbi:hypothetical protein A2954_05985 [Candidatus Roizmanbacteria bacterium RIFCSPLOWO2_01_FULL_37_12]|uniref:Uncharacterized protein n=1 Tax=Candidatus Roizmanbacteria bacterium RIFCSPLOWO2_01_FULL_37_12 TaxID=1802056 RepID=A0A1F7ICH8_9BACT|nr:MAG: hypothetical protein A3D76_01465 [Candidatus Roizmanbacteria bacterium RIFCSPHIGHO2_02_FULL_37_9b]OGK41056.1 MAG: hypothetical protein A2954_05985 [Candidatus Roizmanbacteria bacterium RIFCSPLOWO2_01_FULL_37_12]
MVYHFRLISVFLLKLYQFLARTGRFLISESVRGRKLGAAIRQLADHSPHLPLGLKKGSNFFQEGRH